MENPDITRKDRVKNRTAVKLKMERQEIRSAETEYLEIKRKLIDLTYKSKQARNFYIKIFAAKKELKIFKAETILEQTSVSPD